MRILHLAKYLVIFACLFMSYDLNSGAITSGEQTVNAIKLPAPLLKGNLSVEEALFRRRSVREYRDEPLTVGEVGQLLWSAQGITAGWGGRTAPSAGATYPLEVYLVAGKVEGLKPGLYLYLPSSHNLVRTIEGDLRKNLALAAFGQKMIEAAPATIVIVGAFHRTTVRYGDRGFRYVYMEAGHAGENIYLQAEASGLATVGIGAFNDKVVKEILKLKEDPIYLMPVGKKIR